MNKRHYEHTLPNIRGSLSNTYINKVFLSFTIYLILFVVSTSSAHSAQMCDYTIPPNTKDGQNKAL